MNLYFEFGEAGMVKLGVDKYVGKYNVQHESIIDPVTLTVNKRYHIKQQLLYMAERVWEEKDGKVTYHKNRFSGYDSPVDMKEFLWIKLKC